MSRLPQWCRAVCAPDGPVRTVNYMQGYMGTDEIAEELGVSRDTLYKWAARGFPDWPREAGKLPNGEWRIRRVDFDRWMAWRLQQRRRAA